MIKIPLISCVMVTKGRYELIKKSVYCYTQQTYKNKELIVLSQGDAATNNLIETYIQGLGRSDIQFLVASPKLTLGAMRNLSIELTTGSVVCQWDDDDLYHPLRLVTQYHALLDSGVSASLYSEHLKYFKNTGEIYWIDWSGEKKEFERFLCGTVMFDKKYFYMNHNMLYPESGNRSGKEEDLDVLQKLLRCGRIAPIKEGYQYIYVYHGDNVYWLEHHKLVLDKKILSQSELLNRKDLLTQTFEAVRITEPVVVRSLIEPAFEYRGTNEV